MALVNGKVIVTYEDDDGKVVGQKEVDFLLSDSHKIELQGTKVWTHARGRSHQAARSTGQHIAIDDLGIII